MSKYYSERPLFSCSGLMSGDTLLLGEWTTHTFNEVGQVVLLHVFRSVVKTDVVHLCGEKVPAVHCGSQQGVDARRPSA